MQTSDPLEFLSPAQLAGYVAFVLGVLAFLQREDRRLRWLLTLECAAYVVHFAALGNPPAAASAGVSAIRTWLSLRCRGRWLSVLFMGCYVTGGLILAKTWVSWLPIVGSCFAAWAVFNLSGIRLRAVVLISTCLWLANNIICGSIGGTILESVIALASIATIVRLRRESKSTASPAGHR